MLIAKSTFKLCLKSHTYAHNYTHTYRHQHRSHNPRSRMHVQGNAFITHLVARMQLYFMNVFRQMSLSHTQATKLATNRHTNSKTNL